MALTIAQQRDLYKLGVGMFAAAPGLSYIDAWAQALASGMTVQQIYEALTRSPEFQGLSFGFTPAATDQQFASTLLDQLLGNSVSAANRTIATDFVLSQLSAGLTRGQAIKNAIDVLDAIPGTDPNFGAAAQRLDNRTEVASFYTEAVNVRTTDVDTLRGLIRDVTEDPHTVVQPIVAQPLNDLRLDAENMDVFRVVESDDPGADLAAVDILLVGRFEPVTVGALDPNFT